MKTLTFKTFVFAALPTVAFIAMLAPQHAWAQPAADVVCTGCVDTTDIADGAVTGAKIQPGAIDATKIANGTIGPNKIIPGSINATTIANGSIGPNKLIPGSINQTTIAADAIRSNKILDGAVQNADIADGAVSGNKILNGSVQEAHLDAALQAMIQNPPATVNVNCPGDSLQAAIDAAVPYATIFLTGNCTEDVVVIKPITIDGNEFDIACNKSDQSASAGATINGTLTIRATRGVIRFLRITGTGIGLIATEAASVFLECNDVSNNAESGIFVLNSSHAHLVDNRISGNGTRETDPNIFFDAGLFAAESSSVRSLGNTWSDNQYAAIEIDRQSAFRQGRFLPRQTGGGPAPASERDTFIEKGCDPNNPGTPTGGGSCFTRDFAPVAIVAFNGGLIDIRNADIFGEMDICCLSSHRISADSDAVGHISVNTLSIFRVRDFSELFGDREVTYSGTVQCSGNSMPFGGNVGCGQTCTGDISGVDSTCTP